jgi:hypothetical protein
MVAVTLSSGWDREHAFLTCLPLALACWALSGIYLLEGSRPALRSAVVLLGLAVCFALASMLGVMLPAWVAEVKEGGDDAAILGYLTLLPGLVVLVAVAQIVYLGRGSWTWRHSRKSS